MLEGYILTMVGFLKNSGYCDTILGRKMMDIEAKKLNKDNFTSPKDSEKVLDILCNDKDSLDMLKNQVCNNKLHLYIPEEEILAHKTGELPSVEHDVGRLYFKNGWVDIKNSGYCDTILGRKMMDIEAKKLNKDNFTSPKDSEKVLDILCNDKDSLDMLKNQVCNNKLHLYIPEEEILAHKTGELPSVEHDVGRLYFKNGWVDILVFTQDLKENIDGIRINNEIGKIVYEYYKNRGY